MSLRYQVEKSELKKVQQDLKEEGFTLDKISEAIDADFGNFLYKNHSMSKKTFTKLNEVYDEDIQAEEQNYIDGKGVKTSINIEEDSALSELTGIILGDGYIQMTNRNRDDRTVTANRLVITLHEEEDLLRERSIEMIKEIFNREPTLISLKGQATIQIILHSKEIMETLIEEGLQPGDKVENQISVPSWILKDEELEKKCLKGLIDTDGCIYKQKIDDRTIIQFKNHSENLLRDFEKMCSDINIETSDGGEHITQIASQSEVKKFTKKIKPIESP